MTTNTSRRYNSRHEMLQSFNEFLDESREPIAFGDLVYMPSDVLLAVDPVAYHEEFRTWCHFMDLLDELDAIDKEVEQRRNGTFSLA